MEMKIKNAFFYVNICIVIRRAICTLLAIYQINYAMLKFCYAFVCYGFIVFHDSTGLIMHPKSH